ncbi:DUF1203 domain-containing protein [Thioclava sp.]|uniref:DUF1203 domain-containing protein n=1 Tax=Thioclava sp. TaxID=1933450 RepID=UPI003AA9071D
MPFQIHALPAQTFAPLFTAPRKNLAQHHATIVTADQTPGFPCRVSLADAEIGERVLLVNFTHLSASSPFRSSHAIYVREGVHQAQLAPDVIPDVIASRLISWRGFDAQFMMQQADVIEGRALGAALEATFEDPKIVEIHLHFARQGCFCARVTRS